MMKTSMHILKSFGLGVIVAVALLAAGCAFNRSQSSEITGALGLRQITTAEEEQILKPGDLVAKACTQCKSVIYLNLAQPGSVLPTLLEDHLCPECQANIKRVRVGKTHQVKITYICETCDRDSVFCCATRPRSRPTQGMETK